MLLGKQENRIEYDQLSQYIEGWLHYKENKKYEKFWFVLRGNIIHGRDLCTAYLFCFKDLNIHVEENFVGSVEIHSHDKVELLKCGGNKPMKCDFTILLSETKFHFRADDEISRERWIYALCDLIGKCQPPSELPTERNQIRASLSTSTKKKENDKKSAFHRSRTVELPTTRGPVSTRRRSTPLSRTTASASNISLPRAQTIDTVDCGPVEPPPRSVCSLPFMLSPHTQLNELEWFYPGMRREEAQEKLSSCPVGYYLLRDSESNVGSYTLTFRDSERIKNHMITQAPDRLYRFHNSEVDTAFPSPQKAVEFYMIKKHSKTITPVPYCGNPDGTDRDYLLPSEMNVSAKPTQKVSQQMSPTGMKPPGAYRHRELPPTPDGAVRNLSIEDADDYLKMRDKKPNNYTPHTSTTPRSNIKHNGIERHHSTSDDANGYLKVGAGSPCTGSPLYDDHRGSIDNDNDESYMEVMDPIVEPTKSTKSTKSTKYVESTKSTKSTKSTEPTKSTKSTKESEDDSDSNSEPAESFDRTPTESFDRAPSLPDKPGCLQFCDYDSVRLQDYENQNVIDGAMTEAPPIPPRSSKPELPPRRDTTYRT